MFYVLMFEFMLLGVIGGLLGIFYRNCLKVKDMIFYPLYSKVFVPMVKPKSDICSHNVFTISGKSNLIHFNQLERLVLASNPVNWEDSSVW